jgi:hypothetical protein
MSRDTAGGPFGVNTVEFGSRAGAFAFASAPGDDAVFADVDDALAPDDDAVFAGALASAARIAG